MSQTLYPLNSVKNESNFNKIYSFDIETTNNNKDFVSGAICHSIKKPLFYTNKDLMKKYILNLNENAVFIATNLGFDIYALFGHIRDKYPCLEPFKPLYHASRLLGGHIINDSGYKIKFLDTFNYSPISVEAMGKIINIPKLEKPEFEKGITKENRETWEKYNINDALITLEFYKFLSKNLYNLGGRLKMTTASTSMDLYRRKYQKHEIIRPEIEIINKMRNAYYGGRCECFLRGKIENCYYGDVVSMYPSVMAESYPNPNTLQYLEKGNINNIMDFEGVSKVSIKTNFESFYPFLPTRHKGKLKFCNGTFEGYYTHLELKNAVLFNDYDILDIKEQYFYAENFFPFKDYVSDLYKLKNNAKKEKNNSMEYFYKLLLNSHYGKWGMNTDGKIEIEYIDNINLDILKDSGISWEKIGNYIRISHKPTEKDTPAYVNPILALYTTAKARLKLHRYLTKYMGIYCDTDSIITYRKIPQNEELGKMNFIKKIDKGMIIRPKLYDIDGNIKAKGFKRATKEDFIKILDNKEVKFLKFRKFNETLRAKDRKKYVNETFYQHKKFNTEDDKRIWNKNFSPYELQISKPIYL